MPMPGATRIGLRAYSPIIRLPKKLTSTVAVRAALNGTPAADRMPGLTTMMYIDAMKVAMPASTSVRVVVPSARSENRRSSKMMTPVQDEAIE